MRLFLFAIIAITALGQSQPPPPTPAKPNQTNQDKASSKQAEGSGDKKPSQVFPPTINQPPLPVVAARNEGNCCYPNKYKSPTDWWGRASTILLTIFTGALAWLAYKQWGALDDQHKVMREGLTATNKAACAAQKSADALMSAEKALLVVELEDVKGGGGWLRFKVTNFGKTPAEITSYQTGDDLRPAAEQVLPANFVGQVDCHNISKVVSANQVEFLTDIDSTYLVQLAKNSGETLIFRASVTYLDIFRREHTTEVFYSYEQSVGIFFNLPQYTRYT
jgi:hypothetical protein